MRRFLFFIFVLVISVTVAQETSTKDVPFAIIEEVPVFPGCKGNNREKKQCMQKGMYTIIAKNFNADLANDLGLPAGKCLRYKKKNGKKVCVQNAPKKYKIYLQFKIDQKGKVIDITARAPHPKLEEEAIRIAGLIPQMKPGFQRGKPVRVGYVLPITFNVE